MLKKENRLKKKKDFDAIFKEWKFKRSLFILLGIKKNDLNYSRFGIIVSKKIAKKAVVRNKIKRKIREILRNRIKEIDRGYDVVIIPSKEIVDKNYQEIKISLERGLKKIKILE